MTESAFALGNMCHRKPNTHWTIPKAKQVAKTQKKIIEDKEESYKSSNVAVNAGQ